MSTTALQEGEEKKPQRFDLQRYSTPELLDEIAGLLSVKDALIRLALCIVIALAGGGVMVWLIHSWSKLAPVSSMLICGYAIFISIVAGVALGLLRIGIGMLNSTGAILRLTLRLTEQAASDREALQSGSMQMLSGSQLSAQVFNDVVIPGIGKVMERSFGFLATPLIWVSNRTVRPLASRFLKRAESIDNETPSERGAKFVETLANHSGRSRGFVQKSESILSGSRRMTQWLLVAPFIVLFIASLLVAVLPVIWVIATT